MAVNISALEVRRAELDAQQNALQNQINAAVARGINVDALAAQQDSLLAQLEEVNRQISRANLALTQPTASSAAVAVQADDATPAGTVQVFSASQVNQSVEVNNAGRVARPGDVVGNTIVGGKNINNSESQATPPANVNNTQPYAPTAAGSARGNDDSATPNRNATQTEIDNVFNTGTIVPQANVLDQYSSYTYQASVYLMKPEAFAEMVRSGRRSIAGSQLLFQSGGAPVTGRNPYFTNDYYIDKFELTSTITGKGTNAAHNVASITMTVVEPNGITLIENIDRAVQDYLGNAGNKRKNFQAQLFLLVVRFFGYDQNGNLITPNSGTNQAPNQATPSIAFVEKYYPFALNKIDFKIANKLVEYELSATAVQFQTNVGQSRGAIPYNVELSGLSVKDALLGPAVTGASSTTTGTTVAGQPRDEKTTTAPNTQSVAAPPKAVAAPTPKLTIRQGLITAMNQYQQDLVKQGIYGVADEYAVEFVTNSIESAKIQKPGASKDKTSSPTGGTAADQKLPEKQAVDNSSRVLTATAGKSLVQFIDEIVRNSSYIQEQQKVQILESDGRVVPNGAAKNLAWYKISLKATPLAYDAKRNDYAYRMTYVVHPYKVSEIVSSYFSKPKFPGHHKQYSYWFTGQNTQILSYEQTYNALYYMPKTGGVNDSSAGANENVKLSFSPNSAQSSQGADGKVNEPAANAADYLYSPGDNNTASLTIVGDPAWLQQGELFAGPGKANFDFNPFLPDGTINFDAGQILFEVVFNTPIDYNPNTGLVDPNQQTQTSAVQGGQSAVRKNRAFSYIANKCISQFEKGKFTQNITGTRTNYSPGQVASENVDAKRLSAPSTTGSRTGAIDRVDPVAGTAVPGNTNNNRVISPSTGTENQQPNNVIAESSTEPVLLNPPTPLPAAAAERPSSDGVPLPPIDTIRSPFTAQIQAVATASGFSPLPLTAEQRQIQQLGEALAVNNKPKQDIVKEA